MNGFLLIDKPSSWTSRDICNKIQHFFHIKKVGHTGTLDPFATGLLIITLGNATKAGQFLEDESKEYIAELKLGTKTKTGDLTGEVVNSIEVHQYSIEEIKEVTKTFLGPQKQLPPMTSAAHYKGQKLYTLAHQGIEVERNPKDIVIYSLEILNYENDVITFKAHVSKGTYIRVLGEDIATKLGTIGHLISLRRIRIGNNVVEEAKTLETYTPNDVQTISEVLSKSIHTIKVDDEQSVKIKNGVNLNLELKDNLIFFVDKNGNALAIYKKEDGFYKCQRGLW